MCCDRAFVSAVLSILLLSARLHATEPVSFSREVRPILSEHCFRCHGPDEKQRKAEMRLDLEADAKKVTDGRSAVVGGDLGHSELWKRINSNVDDERMPPPDADKLSPAQIETLRRWIEQGARWEQHWSFTPPKRPPLPAINDVSWPANAIDSFVAAKLESQGLQPTTTADKETLIRRATLDLTGLPPSLDEIDAFLADDSPTAYQKVVERLLATPQYGERMAWSWLEAARYADTSGYQNDGPRSMWRWRDWVIDAFNTGMPFDQFTIEQLAGDMLPNARLEQRIASGFNRNHRGNSEGGIIPEEYQVEYVVDRVDTTSTVWLGLTMGCARCHDHKYDPLTQREFYQFFAYFNNIPEYGRAIKEGNSPPYIAAPTDEQQRMLSRLNLEQAERLWAAKAREVDQAQLAWEATVTADTQFPPATMLGQLATFSFESSPTESPTWKTVNGEPEFVSGKVARGIALDGKQHVEAGNVGDFGYFDKFSVALWVKPGTTTSGTIISKMTDEEQGEGWYLQFRAGYVQVNLIKRWLDDALRVETAEPIPADTWTHLTMTYDGSRQARGVSLYVNGQAVKLTPRLDLLNQTFKLKEPLRIGSGGGPNSRFTGELDEIQLFSRTLTPADATLLATAESIREILAIPRDKRSAGQQLKLHEYFLQQAAPSELRTSYEQLQALRTKRQQLLETIPTVMVMEEMLTPRPTSILIRGEYNRPGAPVTPGVPASLSADATQRADNRLGFARWLVSPSNPLTARVAANRLWQLHFGSGLVRTTEDFGVQGEAPSHPELLDWLAVEFMGTGSAGLAWDLKSLQRLILVSSTYRQGSSITASSAANRAADNRWLARAPRQRLSAEMLRDQALAVSGLLVREVGGPSVKNYQPADLWKDLATDSVYEQDHGANLYRRSLYTYWKRTVAPPSMTTFDASGREACQVRSPRTNTPLQALTMLNELTFVEAARVMAQRVLEEAPASDDERLTFAFRLATSRRPAAAELNVLKTGLQRNREHFRHQPELAKKLIEEGEYAQSGKVESVELAAYTATCNLLLNLDETVTRQ